jgi:hypothetical protein
VTSPASDDEPDDPSLRSMRAVWLSMRDEEPPSSGLAELLAAARSHAAAMQPHDPWWRRALASLRRPPVLALATVVVLLGGAVLISSRRESMDAMPRAEQADRAASPQPLPEEPLASGVAAPPPPEALAKDTTAMVVADPAASGSASSGHPSTSPTGGGRERELKPPSSAGTASPSGLAAGPARPAITQPTVPEGASEAKTEGAVMPPSPPPAPAPPPPPPPPVTTGRRLDNAGAPVPSALDHSGPSGEKLKSPPSSVTVPAPPTPPKSVARPPKQDLQIAGDADAVTNEVQVTSATAPGKSFSADEERGGTKAVRGPTIGQLAKQSETAAARGDCAAVRAIVGRIKKMDATFHKSHVQNNAAVKRCVK